MDVASNLHPLGPREPGEHGRDRAGEGVAPTAALELVEATESALDVPEGVVPLDGWLKLGPRAGQGTSGGTRVSLVDPRTGACLATALVDPAEASPFPALSGLPEPSLTRAVFISDVAFSPGCSDDLLAPLLYMAVRRGRIWGRTTAAAYVAGPDAGGGGLVGFERLTRGAQVGALVPAAQRIDIAAHRAHAAATPPARSLIRRQFVPEAVEILERWVARFFQTPWFRAVREETLTRQQYIYTLSNLHQFVRFTTRLIGRAVGYSDDRGLRNHWLKHLSGEINHELIIEKDLANLGADVDYVVSSMVPIPSNFQFMAGQQSSIGFDHDPALLLASPFVAEGFSARLDALFIGALERAAASWGVENPRHVTSFLSSHVSYDGGDDGHWENTRKILEDHLVDERALQRFMAVVHLSMDAFERSFTAYVEDLEIFAGEPTTAA